MEFDYAGLFSRSLIWGVMLAALVKLYGLVRMR